MTFRFPHIGAFAALLLACVLIVFSIKGGKGIRPMTVIVHANPAYEAQIDVPSVIKIGELTHLTLRVLKNGVPVFVERDHHMTHVIVAGPALDDLDHSVSPMPTGEPGVYDITHIFSHAGQYRLWIEITDTRIENEHGPRADLLASADIIVTGRDTSMPVVSRSYNAEDFALVPMIPELHAGVPATLLLSVKNPAGIFLTLPAIEPFMFAMTNTDFSFYQHGHSSVSSDLRDGIINVTFPSAGTYWMVAQTYFMDSGSTMHFLEQRLELNVR